VEWTPDLAVGIGTIDGQHRELFDRITKLVDAIKASTCKYTIGGTLDFLEEYVVQHFADEQAMMLKYGYPGYEAHKAQHEAFKRDFALLREEFKDESSNYNRSALTNQFVVDWILNHINKVDKLFGEYLREKGVA
jgi:hemerythrin